MMTPLDIEMKEFSKSFLGYNAAEVDSFLEQIMKMLGDLNQDKVELEHKIDRLNEKLDHYKSIEQTLQDTMILAEKTSRQREEEANKEAEKIILEGTFKSDQMVEKARQEVYAIKQNIDGLQKQYNTAKIQMKQMLENQLEILDATCKDTDELNILTNDMTETSDDLSDELDLEDKDTLNNDTLNNDYYGEGGYYDNEDFYTKEYQIINEEDVI